MTFKPEEAIEVYHRKKDGTKGWIEGSVWEVGRRTYLIAIHGNVTIRVHKQSQLIRKPEAS